MKHKITRQMFIGTMVVMIVAELSGAITALIDGLITSRFLGPDMMSAQGIASSYFPIISIINGVLMVGCQALAVAAISKNKKDQARSIITMCAYIGIALTSLISIIIWVAPNAVALLFGSKPGDYETIKNVGDYLKGISIGSFSWFLFVLLTPVVQLDGGGKICTLSSIVMAVVDILGDYLFGIVLDMGLFGMGLASGLSHIASAIVMLAFMFSKRCTLKFRFKNPDFKSLGKVVSNGIPRALSMIGRTLGPILLNVIVLNIVVNGITSNVGMSALAIQRSVQLCASSIGWGIGGALLMIGTLYFNERNYTEFKETLLISLRNIIIFVGGITIVLMIFAPFITRLYIPNYQTNVELYEITLKSLRYYFLSLPLVAFNVSFASFTQATQKNVLTNTLNICIEFIALVAACFLLSINGGYNGFFFGFFFGEAILSIVCVVCFVINYFRNKKSFKRLLLPKDFIKENTLVFEKSLNSIEDALSVSESITAICKGTELSSSQIYKLSLCIEEMAVNVFKHGFTKDNKPHNVMIRVVVEGTKIVLTLIDDCKMFDITKKLKTCEMDPENPEKNIGIRMIMLLAKDIHYSYTMNINNLQIIL